MNPNEAARLAKETGNIHGRLSFEAAMLFAWIDEIQKANGIVGDIFEIGVYHGKSAVLLGAMLRPELEALHVCDLFDEPSTKVLASGVGNREVFERNMQRFFRDRLPMRIFSRSSQCIGADETGDRNRLFHINGRQNTRDILSDLQLAAAAMIKEGAIIVDNPLQAEYPCVTAAIPRFLRSNKRYCLLAMGFNKIVLVRRECVELYGREFDMQDQSTAYGIGSLWQMKSPIFFGYPIRALYKSSDDSRKPLRTRLTALRQPITNSNHQAAFKAIATQSKKS